MLAALPKRQRLTMAKCTPVLTVAAKAAEAVAKSGALRPRKLTARMAGEEAREVQEGVDAGELEEVAMMGKIEGVAVAKGRDAAKEVAVVEKAELLLIHS